MSFGPAEPCGLWQSEQTTLPSRIGWREGRLTSERCCLWHVKQTSDWVSLLRTLSGECKVWQEVQAVPRVSCVLPSQCERLASFRWQDMHILFLSSAARVF